MCSLINALQHPVSLGWFHAHSQIRTLAYRKVNYLPTVLQLNNGGPRMQTPDQSCPYHLSSPGESARKALGFGHQGEAAIQI